MFVHCSIFRNLLYYEKLKKKLFCVNFSYKKIKFLKKQKILSTNLLFMHCCILHHLLFKRGAVWYSRVFPELFHLTPTIFLLRLLVLLLVVAGHLCIKIFWSVRFKHCYYFVLNSAMLVKFKPLFIRYSWVFENKKKTKFKY